ncbi:alpha/beta fold hydrolase [Dokdonella immobilis]|uniref:Alpha/beta hydrolase fold n=1 Tax=Dokdonella immobilis TaxID=578942 RepID=A0A1I4VME3_9GAMM|nr:alpha/beta fold hydrolase [Dokdonella immobilis]SFN02215.1 alpha/beta hydrolase fold [Dokdonella immobilis]
MSMPKAAELRIPLRHLSLAAKAWGHADDPPILAVHGWLDNAASFDRLAPLLPGRRVIALDLAGHGRSDHRPSGSWYPYVDFLDDLGEVVRGFGWPTVDLLGHSLGATLVSLFAALCPERVGRLLLIEGLGPLTLAVDKTFEQLRRSFTARAAFKGNGLRVFPDIDAAIAARRSAGQLSEHAARCIVERGVRAAGEGGVVRPATMQGDAGGSEGGPDVRSGDGDRSLERGDAFLLGTSGGAGQRVQARSGDGDRGLDRDNAFLLGTSGEAGQRVQAGSGDGDRGLDRDNAFPGLSWSTDPALTLPSPTRLSEEQLAVILPNISAKTLLVLAAPEAPYLPRSIMDARIALVRDIEVIRMQGTHHLHLEDPVPVAAAINRFLESG